MAKLSMRLCFFPDRRLISISIVVIYESDVSMSDVSMGRAFSSHCGVIQFVFTLLNTLELNTLELNTLRRHTTKTQ